MKRLQKGGLQSAATARMPTTLPTTYFANCHARLKEHLFGRAARKNFAAIAVT